MGDSGQLYALPLGKISGLGWRGGWMGPRASLDTLEKRWICPYL